MTKFDRNYRIWKMVPLVVMALFLALPGTGMCGTAIKDGAVFKGGATDKKGSRFASSFRVTSLNEATGEFTGEISWPSLNSVHKIEGAIRGNTVVFKETGHIKRGGAHLNCEYAFVFDGQTLTGRWIEPRVDHGPAEFTLQ